MKFGFGSSAEKNDPEKDGPGKNGNPRIERVSPAAAIPGGEIAIHGVGFTSRRGVRPIVRFGEAEATLNLASSKQLVVRVPENASGGALQVVRADHESQPFPVSVAFQIADNLHPVRIPRLIPTEIFMSRSAGRADNAFPFHFTRSAPITR